MVTYIGAFLILELFLDAGFEPGSSGFAGSLVTSLSLSVEAAQQLAREADKIGKGVVGGLSVLFLDQVSSYS